METENGGTTPTAIQAGSLGEKLSRLIDEVLDRREPKHLTLEEIRAEVDELSNALKSAQAICSMIGGRQLSLQFECKIKGQGRHHVNGFTLCTVCGAYVGVKLAIPPPPAELTDSDGMPIYPAAKTPKPKKKRG